MADAAGTFVIERTKEGRDLGVIITDNSPPANVSKLQLKLVQYLVLSEGTSNVLILRISSLFTKAISDHTLNTVAYSGLVTISTKRHLLPRKRSACGNTISPWIQECSIAYEDRFRILGLTTLAVRRKRGDLIECYKILSGKEKLDPNQFFQRSDTTHLRRHSRKLSVNLCRLQLRQNFFSQRVISDWNRLPQDVVDAPSVNSFKNRLDTHWKNTGYGH